MSLTPEEIKKIAHLARLNLSSDDIDLYTAQLSQILDFIEKTKHVDTSKTVPLAHPFDHTLRPRADVVTETNEREAFQQIAPAVDAGLYLVPKVIEEG